MSERDPIPLAQADRIAEQLLALVAPVTADATIVGSVRRRKPQVHDIEIVAYPMGAGPQVDLFGELHPSKQRPLIDRIERHSHEWKLVSPGESIVRLLHLRSDVLAEMYLVKDLRAWGPTVVVRTGPRSFGVSLMTRARGQGKFFADGFLLHAHPAHSIEIPCREGAACQFILDLRHETDVFGALGLPWVAPEERI